MIEDVAATDPGMLRLPLRDQRDLTRARILETALELIADHGFAATSTREISERLGFTKAALYYHFRTKDDLLAAIVQPALTGLAAIVDSATLPTTPAVRRQLVAVYTDLVATHADLFRVVSDDPAVRAHPALASSLPLYVRLTQLLSGTETPGTAERTRVRATLGAIHLALLRAGPDDEPETVRSATVAAACSALGLHPMARRPGTAQ